jgi:hypothetical protein
MPEESLLTRTLKPGSVGADVEGVKRSVHRFLRQGKLKGFAEKPQRVRRTFGPFFLLDVYAARKRAGFARKPTVDQLFWHHLVRAGAPDALAIDLMNEYRDAHRRPELVEPRQGFDSLHKSLWEAYSIGRLAGLTDLGTHNPASTLPGGGPSDHSVYPAYAFDLGFSPQTGQRNPTARAFFQRMINFPGVEYVILGDLIWSRERGTHSYTSGGHLNHVHVSGVR